MIKKICLVSGLVALLAVNLAAQISYGGLPPGFTSSKKGSLEAREIPILFQVDELIEQDLSNEEASGTPPRIAENIRVSFTPDNSGLWTTLPDGSEIWQLRLQAQGALAIILGYDEFYIPEGASLFIYNEARSQVLGAYTHKTHPEGGAFSTEMVAGDDITLELVIPAGRPELKTEVKLHVSDIGYCYNHIQVFNTGKDAKIGESGGCMVNINCSPEGDDWQTEKKGVTQMTMLLNSGWNVCSGTIVNNTAQDLTPYLLSAFHCYEYTDEAHLLKWQFAFHFESSSCKTEEPLGTKTLVGCRLRAYSPLVGGSDGLLLELITPIPEDWDVYYNGWDRRNEPIEGRGVSIHHPAGDIKKISTYDKYETGTWESTMYGTGADDAHWLFQFVQTPNGHSITEGGSSGSPLFSPEHRVIGTLTGGNSNCSNTDGSNYYGKLHYHWDKDGDSPATQMKTWLDPLNSGAETLNGIFFDPVAPRLALDSNSLVLDGQVGEENPEQVVVVNAYNLTEAITASAEGNFELSLDKDRWDRSLQIPQEGGRLYVRYIPATIGYDEGLITLSNPELSNTKYPREYTVGLTANSCLNISIENADMPHGQVGDDYSLQLVAAGSEGPYVFELISGNLPEGLTFDNGVIEGTIMEDGTFNILVSVTDKYDCTTTHQVNLYVICGIVSAFPFHEDFEAEETSLCWKENNIKGNVAWQSGSGVRPEYEDVTTAQNGNYNAVFYDSTYDGNTTLLITPQLDLSGLSNPELTFWYMMPAWGEDLDELALIYKTSAHDEWKVLGSYQEETTGWTEVNTRLPEPSAEYFVAFRATSNYGFGIGIDNLTIKDGGVGLDTIESDNMNIRFNNPVADKLYLEWEQEIRSLSLYTITGYTVYQAGSLESRKNLTIDLSSSPKGIYLLTVKSNQGQKTFKIINH